MTFYQEIVDRSLSQKIYHFRNHFQNSTSISCIRHFPLLPNIIHQGKNENLYTLFFYPVDITPKPQNPYIVRKSEKYNTLEDRLYYNYSQIILPLK